MLGFQLPVSDGMKQCVLLRSAVELGS